MKNKLGDKERLGHIIDYIQFIQKALKDVEKDKFNEDFILHTAVLK